MRGESIMYTGSVSFTHFSSILTDHTPLGTDYEAGHWYRRRRIKCRENQTRFISKSLNADGSKNCVVINRSHTKRERMKKKEETKRHQR